MEPIGHISEPKDTRYRFWDRHSVYVCADCSALIQDKDIHDQFHQRNS